MKKSCFIILLIILLSQILKGVEIISQQEIARRYLNADLVIIGKVISIKTETIDEKKSIKKDGWAHIDRTLIDIYTVKIDSVLKGSNIDSIIIQSKPFPDNEQKRRFQKINNNGDSLFTSVIQVSDNYRGGSDSIHKTGNYIILIKFENNKNILTLRIDINKSNLHFLRKVKGKGLESVIFKLPEKSDE